MSQNRRGAEDHSAGACTRLFVPVLHTLGGGAHPQGECNRETGSKAGLRAVKVGSGCRGLPQNDFLFGLFTTACTGGREKVAQ